jgi:hypothetical protein
MSVLIYSLKLDSSGSEEGPVAPSRKNCNEFSSFIIRLKFFDYLSKHGFPQEGLYSVELVVFSTVLYTLGAQKQDGTDGAHS